MSETTTTSLSMRKFQKVCDILENYEYNNSKLVPILQEIQEEYRYLPEDIMTFVASSLDVPPAKVFGVATFYAHFALQPKGKYVIKVCDGTACHVRHSSALLDAIQEKLGLSDRKTTTDDLLFTLETVSCLGACGLAPVVVINDDVYGGQTPDSVVIAIENILTKEAHNE
ncbi:MAG: NAD(P)H-dependent oxidoreductase subunit E [Ignavibacteria bacterium]|jgi:NADH-quinone oxidoreductase subunit E|nr:NAD(P)H-dependent oxidoreductase subunit E [Ignavibacteria bacterium]